MEALGGVSDAANAIQPSSGKQQQEAKVSIEEAHSQVLERLSNGGEALESTRRAATVAVQKACALLIDSLADSESGTHHLSAPPPVQSRGAASP